MVRKKPVHIVKNAHALTGVAAHGKRNNNGLSNGILENGTDSRGSHYSSVYSWVSSVAVCRSSDLAASGSGNGTLRLWAIENESKGIRPLFELPLAASNRFELRGGEWSEAYMQVDGEPWKQQ